MAIRFFDTCYVLGFKFLVDVRGVQNAGGVLAVRSVSYQWIETLYDTFLETKMTEAKILVMDEGCEEAWRPFTVTEEDIEEALEDDISQ